MCDPGCGSRSSTKNEGQEKQELKTKRDGRAISVTLWTLAVPPQVGDALGSIGERCLNSQLKFCFYILL